MKNEEKKSRVVATAYTKEDDIFVPVEEYTTVTNEHVKRYQHTIYLLMELTGCPRNLIDYLADIMHPVSNIIYTGKRERQNFIDFLRRGNIEYSDSSVKTAIKKLQDKELLICKGRGCYQVNPKYFWRGKNNDARLKQIEVNLSFKLGEKTKIDVTHG
jgi:hypothetical protein